MVPVVIHIHKQNGTCLIQRKSKPYSTGSHLFCKNRACVACTVGSHRLLILILMIFILLHKLNLGVAVANNQRITGNKIMTILGLLVIINSLYIYRGTVVAIMTILQAMKLWLC